MARTISPPSARYVARKSLLKYRCVRVCFRVLLLHLYVTQFPFFSAIAPFDALQNHFASAYPHSRGTRRALRPFSTHGHTFAFLTAPPPCFPHLIGTGESGKSTIFKQMKILQVRHTLRALDAKQKWSAFRTLPVPTCSLVYSPPYAISCNHHVLYYNRCESRSTEASRQRNWSITKLSSSRTWLAR